MHLIEVWIWNMLAGVLAWNEKTSTTSFEYAKSFIDKGIELSPLVNPTSQRIIAVPAHTENIDTTSIHLKTYKGLPLFLSDSLPDKFGTALFSKYLEKKGKNYGDLTPLEKLSYIGARGMGALEFKPAKHDKENQETLDIERLNRLSTSLLSNEPISHIKNIGNLFHVGTSPGGAQPKVLINIDTKTGDIYRGDNMPTENQESWILKFNKDIGGGTDKGKGKVEYAYYLMAKQCGIHMANSALKESNGEYFFMTKRFDRQQGEKLHTQTLHAFAGMNFKLPNTYSYEQIFSVLNKMNLGYPAKEQLFRVMVFNIIGRNVDDHTKNFGFNMDKTGKWRFSPVYDLTFTYNENYNRPTPHFLSVNGKNQDHQLEDVLHIAREYGIKRPKKIINEVNQSLLKWESIAIELGISASTTNYIKQKMKIIPYILK